MDQAIKTDPPVYPATRRELCCPKIYGVQGLMVYSTVLLNV